MLSAILVKNGYEVIETVNGVEALSALQQPDAPRMAVITSGKAGGLNDKPLKAV